MQLLISFNAKHCNLFLILHSATFKFEKLQCKQLVPTLYVSPFPWCIYRNSATKRLCLFTFNLYLIMLLFSVAFVDFLVEGFGWKGLINRHYFLFFIKKITLMATHSPGTLKFSPILTLLELVLRVFKIVFLTTLIL